MILNRFKVAKMLRNEAERLENSPWPLIGSAGVEAVLTPHGYEALELTRPHWDVELARTERVLLCLLVAEFVVAEGRALHGKWENTK